MKEKGMETICKELADWFGGREDMYCYNSVDGKYYISNGIQVFTYDSKADLLKDWLFTLIEDMWENGTDWMDEVHFICKYCLKED